MGSLFSSGGIRQRIYALIHPKESGIIIRRDQAADLRFGAAQLASFAENENTPLYSQCYALPNIVEQLSFSKLRSFVSLFRPSANKSFCLIPPDSNHFDHSTLPH